MLTNTYLTINNTELLGIFGNDVRQTADITLSSETNRKRYQIYATFWYNSQIFAKF